MNNTNSITDYNLLTTVILYVLLGFFAVYGVTYVAPQVAEVLERRLTDAVVIKSKPSL